MKRDELDKALSYSYERFDIPRYARIGSQLKKIRQSAKKYSDRFIDVTDENYDRALYLSDVRAANRSCLAFSAAAPVYCAMDGSTGQLVPVAESGIEMDDVTSKLLHDLGDPAECDLDILNLRSPIMGRLGNITYFEALFHDES